VTVLLVRHGETDWNRDGRVMGRLSVPLNTNGEAQVRRLASMLRAKAVVRICCSPVLRARQTGTILAESLQCPMNLEPGLTEVEMGEWETRYWKDFAGDPSRQNFYMLPEQARAPGGETLREVQTRAVGAVRRLRNSQERQTILLVTHADVIRVILAHFLTMELRTMRQVRIDPASVTALDLEPELTALLYLNVSPWRDVPDTSIVNKPSA
jgi:broad specificity phosphatase PhoE